ncbi:MAG: hypothetical protein LUE64_06965 [Candidatus Gastranaerophilales bacterium]|nr:hypothetical protein [Candidatus Gastranaerophilales bacterium]
MIDKIGFMGNEYRFDENSQKIPSVSNKNPHDEFIKSRTKVSNQNTHNEHMKTKNKKQDIIISNILSMYDFSSIAKGIIKNGRYVFDRGFVGLNTKNGADNVVLVIQNDETLNSKRYECTRDEFFEIMKALELSKKAKDSSVAEERLALLESLHEKLTEETGAAEEKLQTQDEKPTEETVAAEEEDEEEELQAQDEKLMYGI